MIVTDPMEGELASVVETDSGHRTVHIIGIGLGFADTPRRRGSAAC